MTDEEKQIKQAKLVAYEDALDLAIMGEKEITIRWDDKEVTFSKPDVKHLENRIRQMKIELGQSGFGFYGVKF